MKLNEEKNARFRKQIEWFWIEFFTSSLPSARVCVQQKEKYLSYVAFRKLLTLEISIESELCLFVWEFKENEKDNGSL